MSSPKAINSKEKLSVSAVGDRVRQAREKLGLTRKEFAERLENVTNYHLYNYETGRTKLPYPIMSMICYTFGLSGRWILEGDGEMMIDDQHEKNLIKQLEIDKVITKEEMEMLKTLRQEAIRSADQLQNVIRASKMVSTIVRENPIEYDRTKKGRKR